MSYTITVRELKERLDKGDKEFGAGDIIVLVDDGGLIESDVTLSAARQQVVGGGDTGSTMVVAPGGQTLRMALLPELRGTRDVCGHQPVHSGGD